MRILRVNSWDGAAGGTEVYIRQVTAELDRRGHETRTLNLASGPHAPARPEERYLEMPSLGARRVISDPFPAEKVARFLEENYAEFRPDLVHLHHFRAAFGAVGRFFRNLSAPVVFTAHDSELVCPIGQLVRPGNVICEGGILPRCQFTGCEVGWGLPYELAQRAAFDRDVAPQVRAFLCPSQSIARYLETNGYGPTVHVPSFVEVPAAVEAAPPPLPSAQVPPTIGYLGRVEPYKGLDDLVDAVALLRRAWPAARLTIAGDGSWADATRERARQRGVGPAVELPGVVAGRDKEHWFAGLHVLAVPSSRFDNTPLVAMEAMLRARPVVATRIGGIPEVVQDGRTGRTVPFADPTALAAGLAEVFSSPDLARRWGLSGRERALQRFTAEAHLSRLLAVYRAVSEGLPLPPPLAAS